MVNEAEKFKDEDEKLKERIQSKNGLESYAYNMKQSVEDEKVKDKISEDEKLKERIQSKNGLESSAYNMKQSVEDEKVKDKISEEDRKTVVDKCEEIIKWLDENQ